MDNGCSWGIKIMEISDLKKELLTGKVRPFYVFTGDELALQDIYIDKIKEVSGLQMLRVESLASVYSKLTTKALFKTAPTLYVIRNDDQYLKSEKNWDKFVTAENLKDNVVIMLYSGLEKATKFINRHEPVLTKFDFVGTSILKNRLHATTKMPLPYCEDIVKLCNNNYGRIKNELYKLQVFGRVNKLNWNASYLKAKEIDLIHEDIGDIIFEFTNAVINRNIKKAYELWPKMKYTGDGPMRVMSVLYNSFRQILMVQSTEPQQRTEQVLGMTKSQIFVTSNQCGKYNLFELVNIVKTLRYLEKGIKIGTVAEEFAMDYLMGTIW